MKRKIAAILAADIVAYSRLVAEDEEDTLTRLASYRRVFDDFVTRAGGRIFNTAGDSVLAEFSSAVEATRCAIDIQESMRTRNLGYAPSRQMLFRMGLTIGDVVEREGDLLGDGVNIAARLESLAAPGGICVSQSIFEQVANKLSVPFRDMGRQDVKNIPQPVHAFMVEMHTQGVDPKQGNGRRSVLDLQQQGSARKPALVIGLAALVLMAGAGAVAAYLYADLRLKRDNPQIAKVDPKPTPKTDAKTDPKSVKTTGPAPDRGSVILRDAKKSDPPESKNTPQPNQANADIKPDTAVGLAESASKQAATQQAALPVPPAGGSAGQNGGNQPPQAQTPPAQGKPQIPAGASPAQVFALSGEIRRPRTGRENCA